MPSIEHETSPEATLQEVYTQLKFEIQAELIPIYLDIHEETLSVEEKNGLVTEKWILNRTSTEYDQMVNEPSVREHIARLVRECMPNEVHMKNEILVYLSQEL